MHRLMPICTIAANLMRGGHDHGQQPVPARQKQEPVKRLATVAPHTFRLAVANTTRPLAAPSAATAYRSFITLGAVRCDQDVGLYVLFLDTLLI
jgi:hypothetical protein